MPRFTQPQCAWAPVTSSVESGQSPSDVVHCQLPRRCGEKRASPQNTEYPMHILTRTSPITSLKVCPLVTGHVCRLLRFPVTDPSDIF